MSDAKALEEMFYDSMLHSQNAVTVDRKLRQRVENQDEGMLGMQTALVVSTIDPLKMGRVRIYNSILSKRNTPIDSLLWASPISPFGGFDDCGAPWVPPAGSRVAIFMMNGDRNAIYYIGTLWDQHRGTDSGAEGGHLPYWDYYANMDEYNCLWANRRNGYTPPSPNDGDQVYPPWNTESYMGYDLSNERAFYSDREKFKKITYPYIYGMKTPEKHSIKLVDGDHKCNKRWKRFEMRSSCNNVFLMKDDHLHPAAQYAFGDSPIAHCHDNDNNPMEIPCCDGPIKVDDEGDIFDATHKTVAWSVDPITGVVTVIGGSPGNPDAQYDPQPVFACEQRKCTPLELPSCVKNDGLSHPSIMTKTKFANPFYKRTEEQAFYEGAATPMGNKCELDQSGIQLQSISGHQFVMDDSVEEPMGVPTWDRQFDFGCNNVYKGKTFWRSTTGHQITLNDSEDIPALRNSTNGIFLETATGNSLIMSDDTEQVPFVPNLEQESLSSEELPSPCDCPPNKAGKFRGISAQTTSNHVFQMIDHQVHQCAGERVNGGIPKLEDQHEYEGYILLRSGYGLQLMMKDQDIQTETKEQFIQLLSPQTDNHQRGPHMMVMQEQAEGPGLVLLRAGGVFYQVSYDDSLEIVGVDEENPSNKMCQVSDNYLIDVKNYYYNHNDLTLYHAEKYIFLLAGRDCPTPDNPEQAGDEASVASEAAVNDTFAGENRVQEQGPCIFPVICAQDPWRCPVTGAVHFGFVRDPEGTVHDSRSERVFVSGRKNPPQSPPSSQGDAPLSSKDYKSAGGNPPHPDSANPPKPDAVPNSMWQNGEIAMPTTQDYKPATLPNDNAVLP